MHQPIAVFDAGIGSYAIVAEIHKHLPKQDIVYFADRASFPFGSKGREELLAVMHRTLRFLEGYSPSAIVIASNAPSIIVLDDVRQNTSVPLLGVYPPIEEALAMSASGKVGIMGVHSLIESSSLKKFIARHASHSDNVSLINASSMVEFVENGAFLFDPKATQKAVTAFIDDVFRQHPDIDTLTLSSTHLPWLRPFFEAARPNCRFLDPAESIVTGLGEGTLGTGQIQGLVTESETYNVETFRRMLQQFGVDIPLEIVSAP
ncbi:aspartate/glutamate racemase family protein [Halomonas sp. CUBES01]|uniref:glutamate racemase n=1 Tax=Halomonas sp. CUBES01 TaxID=2897340 RepID=UPI001E5BDBF7|nr:aspartate/glutamate racemase family protein [Halomonas sp. CUBES01]MEC4766470.1 aspartate/glutamate racemase family protein [Halomonas sp. CUBES01]